MPHNKTTSLLSILTFVFFAFVGMVVNLREQNSSDITQPSILKRANEYKIDNEGSIDSIAIMFYNVENLFDTYNDSLTNDNEFTPTGSRHWTSKRYLQKINNLFKVIIAADTWTPPAIIALAEIENRSVLEDLIYKTNLERYNYGIVHSDSPDRRGIDVALLYSRDRVKVLESDFFIADGWESEEFASRYVLRTKCEIMNDTIHLFVCHLPSKLGGTLASQEKRQAIITTIRSKIDSLSTIEGKNVKVVVTGDLNVEYNEDILDILTNATSKKCATMYNMVQSQKLNEGTYKYQGRWEIIDQMIVSEGLLNTNSGQLFTNHKGYHIVKEEFMFTDDKTNSGKRPFRTFYGYRYEGGYSDHLPILQQLYRTN